MVVYTVQELCAFAENGGSQVDQNLILDQTVYILLMWTFLANILVFVLQKATANRGKKDYFLDVQSFQNYISVQGNFVCLQQY